MRVYKALESGKWPKKRSESIQSTRQLTATSNRSIALIRFKNGGTDLGRQIMEEEKWEEARREMMSVF